MTQLASHTIFALSTAPGRAGVAVVRISGEKAGTVLEALTGGKRPAPRHAALRTLRDPATGSVLDRGLVLWLPGPASFTGEDCAELHIHGGPAVIKSLLATLTNQQGCRLAEPGEFSRRAFENGKIDLAEAEGVADLIEAETEAQRRQALAQAGGALSDLYHHWRAHLIDASALTEAAIDFSDESDVAEDAFEKARAMVVQVLPEIQAHLDDGHRGEIVRDGFRVALIGPPNVGKSSLLNALARRDVAIVSAEAGTTRDVVEVRLDLKGYPIIISDTAGLREDAGDVEREGMRRARNAAERAQLVLVLFHNKEDLAALPEFEKNPEKQNKINVLSKVDLKPLDTRTRADADLAVSAETGAGLEDLIGLIADRAAEQLATPSDAPVISQLRHRQALEFCVADLEAFIAGAAADTELRAEDLRGAITVLGRITGRVDVEDILDQVFGRFCIGK